MENESIGSDEGAVEKTGKIQGILRFDLDDFDARREFEIAINGNKYKDILWEIKEILRSKLKYGHEFEDADAVLEWLQKRVIEECQERDVTID